MENPMPLAKTHAFAMPRHFRYVFLVGSMQPSEMLIKLIIDNYGLWGGRFNPIIPVFDDHIPDAYLPLIRNCDPDVVYYSTEMDLEQVRRQLDFCHPSHYQKLSEDGRNNFPGVMAVYKLAEANHSIYTFYRNRSFIHTGHQADPVVPNFFKLSFGFKPRYIEYDTPLNGYKSFEINLDNLNDINRIMAEELPSLTSLLSELKSDQRLFDPNDDWNANKYELIVYDPENAFQDLIYFWNRRLYQYKDQLRVKQLIATPEEIRQLIQDEFFEKAIKPLITEKLFVVSNSLELTFLQDLVKEIRQRLKNTSLEAKAISEFPYPVMRATRNNYQSLYTEKQVLIGERDYLRLPSPFTTIYPKSNCGYAMDLKLIRQEGMMQREIKFPFGTATFGYTQVKGRITDHNRLSLVIDGNQVGVDLSIPSDTDLVHNRLTRIEKEGQYLNTNIGEPRPSGAGLKLNSFVNLFRGNWHEIDYFLSDPFWLNLIRRITLFPKNGSVSLVPKIQVTEESEVGEQSLENRSESTLDNTIKYERLYKSNIPELKGVFCHKDLVNELKRYYFLHHAKLRNKISSRGGNYDDPQKLRQFIYKSIDEDIQRPINTTLDYFVRTGIMFLGMRVKCEHCGGHEWYPLKSLDDRMSCKGCMNQISPSVTGDLYYKFNDIIVNNVKSNAKENGEEFDGNYIVLRTLAGIYENNSSRVRDFIFSPCLDVNFGDGRQTIVTDIDLVYMLNGKLIIGEAKADSAKFKSKEITNLIATANRVQPDQIILAYEKGNEPTDKIEQIHAGLTYSGCEVFCFKVSSPSHKTGRISFFRDDVS